MAKWTHFYIIRIEFLGFRYHGWQKQAELKTVQGMIDKTFSFIFKHENYKTLGCGRTDAKVSADDFVLELFVYEPLETEGLLKELNINLPSDIRAKSVEKTNAVFNIIQDSKTKEYHYKFSFGQKSHPYNAPFITDFGTHLDIEKTKEAAAVFSGIHNFKRYASKPSENTVFEREILLSIIEANNEFSANFVPRNTYIYKVKAKGFLRYQVRLMMGAIIDVGRGETTIEELKISLIDYNGMQVKHIAPSSGLILHEVNF